MGDTIPAAVVAAAGAVTVTDSDSAAGSDGAPRKRRRRGGRGRGGGGGGGGGPAGANGAGASGETAKSDAPKSTGGAGGAPRPARQKQPARGGGRKGVDVQPIEAFVGDERDDAPFEIDEKSLTRRRGRERNGRPVGRYFMCVSVRPEATQNAVLEGRALVEHNVSRPSDDVTQIHGNIYLGKVQNVLPGMEAALDRKSTRLNSSHSEISRMPSSA